MAARWSVCSRNVVLFPNWRCRVKFHWLETAELLTIHAGSPVLRIRQAIFSTQSKPTVYVIGWYRCDRHTLMIRRFRR